MKKISKGSWVALVTPFTNDGKIDFKALERLVEMHIAAKTDGIVVCGTTGEAATLSLEEKMELLSAVKSQLDQKTQIMFGTGSNDTKACIQLTEKASEMGVDSVLVVTPYYNKPTQSGLIEHYKAIAATTDLPIVLYNVPGRTACNMLPKTVLELSKVKNIVAVKEASGNLEQTMQIIKNAPADFMLFSGEDALNLPIMLCGGVGTISVTANIAPKMMKRFNDLALNLDFLEARAVHFALLDAHKALFMETNPIPAKAALSSVGIINNYCRLPLSTPTDDTTNKMKEIIKTLS